MPAGSSGLASLWRPRDIPPPLRPQARRSAPWEASVALPDFFIAGVPKAGTTALHSALARHSALYMSPVKEPKFFLTDGPPPAEGGPGDAKTYREHVWRRADYEELFARAPRGSRKGE